MCNVYRCISSTCAHVHMVVYKCMYIMNELSSAILSPVRADITITNMYIIIYTYIEEQEYHQTHLFSE